MIDNDRFDKEIKNIIKQLISLYKPQKVILFGSLVRNSLRAGSDIDLFIVKEDVPHRGVDRIRQLDRLIRYKLVERSKKNITKSLSLCSISHPTSHISHPPSLL